MKKRKGSLIQRMLAVLLTVVLVVSMVSNVSPANVLAYEGSDAESISGNVVELTEEATEQENAGSNTAVDEENGNLPALLEQIATLPDAEEYLATKQDVDSGDLNGLHWEFDSTSGTLTVSGTGEMGGLGSTQYGWHSYRASIQKVMITSGVTEIGSNAFRDCPVLTEVIIPDTVMKMRSNVFYNCPSLSRVTIPNSVEEIGVNAFYQCGLTNVTIPGSVKNLSDSMFFGCSSLASVTIENGVETIGNNVFGSCGKLTAITIPGSVKSIGAAAFGKCIGLRDVTFEGTDTIPTLNQSSFNHYGPCPCVKYNAKGLHIPSCRYLEAYLAVDGWSDVAKNIDAPHTLSYTASGAVITQTCSVCGLSATAEISTDNAEYTGTGNAIKPAKITYSSDWVGEKPKDTDIIYENNINPGTATAKLTIGGTTAELSFTILPQTYAVTVYDGSGTGNYRAGDTVTITANTPASGKQFDRWMVGRGGIVLVDSTSSTTTFTMPTNAVDVAATYKDIEEEHIHNYGQWQHNDTQHWKECSCGDVIDRGTHDFENWITDREATAIETGAKHRKCQTCGYRQTGTIPATGTEPGSGTVTPGVEQRDNTPAINIATPIEELKDILLTAEEKLRVQNGTNVKIVLDVWNAGNTVSDSDKEAVRQALNGFTVGQYLNIDLYKLVGEDRTDISETAKKIRIVITVPDSLKNADSSKTRTFAIVRVHDGSGELLPDLDDTADAITVETDRFSTYTIVYKDTANSSGGENSGNDANNGNNGGGNDTGSNPTKDNEPKTGETTPLEIYATLAMIAGFTYLLLYFTDWKRSMTEEKKNELVAGIVRWAKQGGRIRKCLALVTVFILLVYYHSIGKKTCTEWKEIYEE